MTSNKAAQWLRRVADIVEEKGRSYGDSIGKPLRVFSRLEPTEGVKVRIDDKLSRIANGSTFSGDNDIVDLVGYLALLAALEESHES